MSKFQKGAVLHICRFPRQDSPPFSPTPLKGEAKIARGNVPGTQDRPRTSSVGASETSRPNPPFARPVRACPPPGRRCPGALPLAIFACPFRTRKNDSFRNRLRLGGLELVRKARKTFLHEHGRRPTSSDYRAATRYFMRDNETATASMRFAPRPVMRFPTNRIRTCSQRSEVKGKIIRKQVGRASNRSFLTSNLWPLTTGL
jgi:hypothetical protein